MNKANRHKMAARALKHQAAPSDGLESPSAALAPIHPSLCTMGMREPSTTLKFASMLRSSGVTRRKNKDWGAPTSRTWTALINRSGPSEATCSLASGYCTEEMMRIKSSAETLGKYVSASQ